MENDTKALTDLLDGLTQLRTIFEKQNRTEFLKQIDEQIKNTYEKIRALEQKQ